MAMSGRVAAFLRTDGTPVTFTNEALTNTGDNKDYYITNATKRYWDDTVVPTVQISTDSGATWSAVATSNYTIEYVGGHIKFKTAQSGTALFRVTGSKAFATVQVAGGFGWTVDPQMDTVEVTTFESGGFKQYASLLKSFTGNLDSYWIDEKMFALLGKEIIGIFYLNNSASGGRTERIEGKVILSGIGINSPVDAVVEQKVDMQGDGGLYYRTNN